MIFEDDDDDYERDNGRNVWECSDKNAKDRPKRCMKMYRGKDARDRTKRGTEVYKGWECKRWDKEEEGSAMVAPGY